jgi:subtilase family serine protease
VGIVSSDLSEAQLDVEWSGASAPGATIKYVTVGASRTASVMDSLVHAITNKVAPIITISYGACEVNWGQSYLNLYNQYFQQANAQGITVVGPSGDSGATDCDYQEASATQGLAVDFPASSPYVTGAGGTMFSEGTGTYWGSSNGSYSGSALGYIPETVWNETDSTGLAASGGGISSYFAKPSWQLGTGVPADLSRDVPDISLNSASAHDGYLYCAQGSCTNGYRDSNNNLNVVGGTSVASPTFAGILALVEQQLGNTTGLGNVNPMIYGLANSTYYGNVFHDATTGNNNSPCVAGTKDCPGGGSIGYSAGIGYDRATGWGSLDVYNLATKWSLVSPAGSTGTIVGSILSNTAISSSATSCGVSASSTTFTVKVTGVTGSGGIPSGTVQILVDNVTLSDSGSILTLDSNGTATYQLNTSTLSGAHTITAVYSGNSTFAASKNTTTSDFVSSTQKDFAITPCASTLSVKTGGTGTATFTLTPFNSFSGNVTLTATSEGSLVSTLTFSPTSPITISSTSPTTFTLKIAAYQTSAMVRTNNSQTVVATHHPSGKLPWYGAGSGTALACTLLLIMPRRRRWGAILAAVISVATFTAIGCGGGASGGSSSSSGSGSGSGATTTNATVGTYTIRVTGISGSLVHSTELTLNVTQ